ncbi:type II toxin-antitoxin system PemK/MazF family toxin [Ovoidimarina sediminis]|uniref:type II toxin-antitoxin system PemK/MazF family toxin n=1 Tax=Ovoidimarina sediminis TaxID=3079856 RepID=UPI0029062379|nr:type II toxin-antitoxin system PemK/MazF family toxin [Rhodophyticola sp. MJ-SS7]MDU8942816.1 type II toxin-antitoxin system PemK/MazF family toxin [Rhodophyticola sp. MJ-SS7]
MGEVPSSNQGTCVALTYHPSRGSIVTVRFEPGFVPPEMVKRRLAVVLSPAIRNRPGLCTVVPLSTTDPEEGKVMPYHYKFRAGFEMPKEWGDIERWVKGDMVCTVGWHRVDLLRLGKRLDGSRIYQKSTISDADFAQVQRCVLHGLGLSTLTKHI